VPQELTDKTNKEHHNQTALPALLATIAKSQASCQPFVLWEHTETQLELNLLILQLQLLLQQLTLAWFALQATNARLLA
jgi:hypothetical protein